MNNEFISVKDFLQGKKNIHFNDSTQPNKKEKTKKKPCLNYIQA